MSNVIELKIAFDPALINALVGLGKSIERAGGSVNPGTVVNEEATTAATGKNKGGRPPKKEPVAEATPPEAIDEDMMGGGNAGTGIAPDDEDDLGLPATSTKKDEVKYTADDVIGALSKYKEKHGAPKAKELLKKYHAKTWQELKEEHYGDFIKLCK